MRIVADAEARELLRERGAVFVSARSRRCCSGRQHVLEATLDRPDRSFDLVHAAEGFEVWATTGLRLPDELHLELDRRGRLEAYWNGQGWIG